MGKLVSIGPWKLEVDAEGTKKIYQTVKHTSPADCNCQTCRNFLATGEKAFPVQFLILLQRLGIEASKAAEVYAAATLTNKHVLYGVWFHCIGHIQAGPQNATADENVSQWPWHEIAEGLQVVVDTKRALAFPEFGDTPLVRIEFQVELPWILSEKLEL